MMMVRLRKIKEQKTLLPLVRRRLKLLELLVVVNSSTLDRSQEISKTTIKRKAKMTLVLEQKPLV